MAKKKKGKGGKGKGLPAVVKTLVTMVVGGVVGEIASPVLPGWLSGPGLGIAGAGLLTKGFSKRAAPFLIAGGAIQTVKMASTAKPVMIAKASVYGAKTALAPPTQAGGGALPSGGPASQSPEEALELAKRAAGG